MRVYTKISEAEYLRLCKLGQIPKAIPSMCVIVIKYDKHGKPHRAKCRIVALGNFEDRYYDKSKRYAPVLKYSSLCLLTSMAVADRCVLQQGDCKNAFCNAKLPDDERMVIRPPVGDPSYNEDEFWLLNKTLYGLRRSPKYWYNMITSILKKMNLKPSSHDPYLYSGVVNTSSHDSASVGSDASTSHIINDSSPTSTRQRLHVGIYVDDFVFYSTDPAEEKLFQLELE